MGDFPVERQIELLQIRNRLREIWETVYSERQPLGPLEYCVTGKGKGPERMPRTGWKPFAVGKTWGGYDETTWFRMTARIPKAWAGQTVVALIRPAAPMPTEGLAHLSSPGEALVYVDGVPAQGVDMNRDELLLAAKASGGEKFSLALEAVPSVRLDVKHVFQYADLAIRHAEPWNFYWDVEVALRAYETYEENHAPGRRLLALLGEAVRKIDLTRKGTPEYYSSFAAARRTLRRGLEEFAHSYGLGKMILIGHSHIDTAWLWPLRETRRKVGRTFANVLALMDRYPEFHFSFSQPELYMYAKEHYPELWKRLKQRVKEGRWEPCGAPWIEQDSNITGGESIIRQFLYGNRFLEKEFGFRSRTAWLPDAFGYPWSLPQILKKCQIDVFVTTKIDWSVFTRFPYSLFDWQGVDGTKIFTVMPPLPYNGNPVPKELIKQWTLFRQKERVDELPFAFGWGDGGGGPTMEMIEHGRRLKNMAGVPPCEFGRTQDCLDRMRAQCAKQQLPVYNGELYLELHRGCQTTQARTKRNNRECERMLHDAEFLASLAHLHGAKYDHATLWKAWRTVLTNQFHDILPGSSITEVYAQADKDYAEARAHIEAVRDAAMSSLLRRIDTAGVGQAVVVFNTLSWLRTGAVSVKLKPPKAPWHVLAPDGTIVPSQQAGPDQILFEVADVPPLGYAVYRVASSAEQVEPLEQLQVSDNSMENDFLRVKWDAHGRFTSVYDKVEEREVVPKGRKANVLQLFEDRPHMHDAWDIDHNFDQEKMGEPSKAEEMTILERGPVRAMVRMVRRTERSTFTLYLTMHASQPRIDVRLEVVWHEKRTLLKVAFPIDVLTHRATYEIQFGAIERATHRNTEYDRARFEVTGQKWADLSEGDYGASLLNDCKYGYDTKGNVLRLSLLRSSIDPDPQADEGEHEMTYSLYPHADDWRNGAAQQACALNYPLLALPAPSRKG
ncbi:MAG: alpha-mannosidase, partial [Candidatus Hydrogenedentes bacterium]|nr:alpha-mannosidase [Candidatus Hydrogenedentota bacterium]